ncbi:hypothetical protein [Mucilaginibacter jinjuensis]|uniref:Uncharacterized protein n=1 Tax=Mucilaginibacter jinjuensis TaxID=1176721 RepID=A0ABY7T211_9SPHI|nr:hypothetical protein [Mucilaginibacter jinjuensis]WCT10264.1 hypothetical protein PQO05_16125 [Mucilaginibacter jinjuensis]
MKKTDVYEIAVRLMGIYLITQIIYSLRGILEILFYSATSTTQGFGGTILLSAVFGLVMFSLTSYFLIFRTKIIVAKITKPDNVEDEVKLFAGKKTIYEIALVLIGGLTFIWSLPDVCYGIYNYFHLRSNGLMPPNQLPGITIEVIKLLFGILIILSADLLSTAFSKEK